MQDKAPREMQYGPTLPVEDFAPWLQDRISSYYRYLQAKNFLTQWKKCYTMYYGGKVRGGSILKGGDEGQYSIININDFRTVVNALITLCVDERPAWEPKAINSDVKSMRQTVLARGLLDYYMREKRVERDLLQAVEFSVLFGEGFVSVEWDPTMGKIVSVNPDDMTPINAGDLRYMAHEPIDIIRDVRLEQYRQRDWVIVRKYVNKWDLAAKFPEFADDISRIAQGLMFKDHYRLKETFPFSTDIITLFCFYHSHTPACPKGRFTMMLEDQTIVADGILPYEHIPLFRVAPSDIIGSPFGYPQAYDLTAIQENLDMLYSTILTNQEMFGVLNVLIPIGAGINHTQLPGQMNFIEYNKDVGKPETMKLLEIDQSLPNMIKTLEEKMIQIAGLNSVSMGNIPSANMSGAALALLDAKAIKLNQPIQWSYVGMLEDLGTMTIQILKDFAKEKRVAVIVGKNNKSNLLSFSGEDIDQIDRVLVEEANPISKTVSGKLQLAQLLLQAKVINTADELLELVNTGTLEPLEQGKQNELLGIAGENEALSDGKEVAVMRTDDHVLHINEHKAVLADPVARNNPQIVAIVGNHINAHIDMLSDPNNAKLFQLIHEPSLAAQGGGPGTPGGPPGNGGPPTAPGGVAGATGAAGQVAPTAPPQQGPMPHQPSLPNAPTNPATHAPAPMPAGAAVKQ